jgi:asparagine synthase (glutamine-hydrolysing)
VAEHCRTDHHEVTLEGEDLMRALPLLLWHAEEPRSAPLLPQSLLFERAARDVRVVLMGEGADELFGGYARLKTALGPLAYLPASWGRSAYLVARHGGGRGQAPFTDGTRQAVDQAAGEARLGEVFRQRGLARAAALLAYEQGERMPKSNLMEVDLMAMSHSVEARLPFLDTQIVQLANRLPVRWKTRWRGEKRLLRLAARELLPPAIAARPKLGLANPLRTWNAAGFLDLARELLSASAIERRATFRQPHLARLLRRAERGRMLPFDLHRLHLFVLIEAWHRVFIDPPRCAPPPPTLFLRRASD